MNKYMYNIEGTEYELAQAASGHWSVAVERYAEPVEIYGFETKLEAMEFILQGFECEE